MAAQQHEYMVEELRRQLIDEIKQTADKLAIDGATRGDLKILNRALKELRYAFKVFTPFWRALSREGAPPPLEAPGPETTAGVDARPAREQPRQKPGRCPSRCQR